MLDNLRKMEPLSAQEENRIMHRLRMTVLVIALAVLAFVVWSIVKKREFSTIYYVIVILFLAANWILTDVAPIFLARVLAGRTSAQAGGYLKAVLFGLLANAGLGWFLLSMNNQSLYGALVYLLGITMARKQRDIYRSEDEAGEENAEEAKTQNREEAAAPEHLPTAADRMRRLNELSAQFDAETDGNNMQPDEVTAGDADAEIKDTGESDGSV